MQLAATPSATIMAAVRRSEAGRSRGEPVRWDSMPYPFPVGLPQDPRILSNEDGSGFNGLVTLFVSDQRPERPRLSVRDASQSQTLQGSQWLQGGWTQLVLLIERSSVQLFQDRELVTGAAVTRFELSPGHAWYLGGGRQFDGTVREYAFLGKIDDVRV